MKRIRKPRRLAFLKLWVAYVDEGLIQILEPYQLTGFSLTSKQCRRLAKWLERAASYLDSKKVKK